MFFLFSKDQLENSVMNLQNIMENGHNGQNQDQSGQNSHHNVSIFISIYKYFCSQGSQVFS